MSYLLIYLFILCANNRGALMKVFIPWCTKEDLKMAKDAVNKVAYDHVPVSLLLHRSSAASLGLFPFTSASLCSKLTQDSLLELLSSVGDGGKLPSREVLHEKGILRVETRVEKVQKQKKN